MDVKLSSVYFLFKINLFRLFAYVLFGSIFCVFAYYKLFGEDGFVLIKGYFKEINGIIGFSFLLGSFVVVMVGVGLGFKNNGLINLISGLLLLLSGFIQIRIVVVKVINGLYPEGDVLKSLAVDDTLFFALFYFVSFFYVIYLVTLAILYVLSSIYRSSDIKIFESKYLYKLFQPLLFAGIGLYFVFYFLI